MGLWVDVIKVMKSKLFSDTLKNGAYTVDRARKDGWGNVIANTYATQQDVNQVVENLDNLERGLDDGQFLVGRAVEANKSNKADYLSLSNRVYVNSQTQSVSGTGVFLVNVADSKGNYTDIFYIELAHKEEGALTKGQHSSYYGNGINGGQFSVNDRLDTSAKIVCIVKIA